MSAYRPSPRPSFDHATALRGAEVTRHVWGDAESGEVLDWIYVSSGLIHQIVFGVPVGSSFRHSDAFRTIFAADEVLHVLCGAMVLANPATGEAHRVDSGESAFFRRDTWHHAHSVGTEPLRVLEIFAPPPATGSSGSYARTKDLLTDVRLGDDELLGARRSFWAASPGQARMARRSFWAADPSARS
jgi:mannose-6-phosphate isomerase-like protein (cupin superfamily)